MSIRSVARYGVVVALAMVIGACQPPARDDRPAVLGTDRVEAGAPDRAEDVPAGEIAATVFPVDAVAGDAPSGADDAPGDAAAESGSHCGEPPERIAARENMRQMAERHAQMSARLLALRTELEAQAKGIMDGLTLEGIPAIAADLAARAAEVPDTPPVNARFLEKLLREGAFWAVLCRALQNGPAECDRLDSAGPGDGGYCRSVVRLVQLARERPSGLSLFSAIGRVFGWSLEQLRDERIWQVVLRGKSEAACDRLVRPEPPERWPGPLCRALAARDVSRCAALADDSRRRTCAALVHAILGPGTAVGDQPSAAGALLRERVAPTGPGSPCAAGAARIPAELFDAVGVFEPGPLVLPDIERERGLAPPP